MSYSRWKDERYWPAFAAALSREHPILTEESLLKAKEFNAQRYYFQGIGRYAPPEAYARGLADLKVLAHLVPAEGYVHGARPTTVDAAIYGFIANIYFYAIETPLKDFVAAQAQSRAPLHRNPRRHWLGAELTRKSAQNACASLPLLAWHLCSGCGKVGFYQRADACGLSDLEGLR